MKLQPLFNNILVKLDEKEDVSDGGIVLINSVRETPNTGEIIAVGPGTLLDNGKIRPVSVKPTDRVMFGSYSGSPITLMGEKFVLLTEEELFGVMSEDTDREWYTRQAETEEVPHYLPDDPEYTSIDGGVAKRG